MAVLTALAPIGPNVVKKASGTAYIVTSGLSGGQLAGVVGTVVGTLVAIVTLYVTITANNRTIRRQRAEEIQEAIERAVRPKDEIIHSLSRDVFYWRSLALGQHGAVYPPADEEGDAT